MRGRRLFCDRGDSPSSRTSRKSRCRVRDEAADVKEEVPRGHLMLYEQIESRSGSPRDDDGSASSSSDRGDTGGSYAHIGIDSAGSDMTSISIVHDEPCESDMARPRGSFEGCVVPSLSGENDESGSLFRSNGNGNFTIAKPESSTVKAIAMTDKCDLEIFSPRYCQCPDDISTLPHSNTLSMLDEETKSEEDHKKSDVDETRFGRVEESRSNTSKPQANKSYNDEHQAFGTNMSKLRRTLTGDADINAVDTTSFPDNDTASLEEKSERPQFKKTNGVFEIPRKEIDMVDDGWQKVRLSIENDEAEPTTRDADYKISSEIGNNGMLLEEKFSNDKIDVGDEENGFIRHNVRNEPTEDLENNVYVTEACRSNLQAGKATASPASPPEIGRITLKETSNSFQGFDPVAVAAPNIAQSFSEKKTHFEQQNEVQQQPPRDSRSPSVSSSATTTTVCNARRSHLLASEVNRREDAISSQLQASISPKHTSDKRQRQQSTKITHARVSTSPISRPQRSSELIDRTRVNGCDDYEESSLANRVERETRSSPAHPLGQHHDTNEFSFGPDNNDFSGGFDPTSPTRMHLSTRPSGKQRTMLKHKDGFPSPSSTVAATVHEFTAPRQKMHIIHEGSDRPYPIPSGGAGQSKRFGVSSSHMSSSNDRHDELTSASVYQEAAEGFERVSYRSSSNHSEGYDDLTGKESRSKKKMRKIEKKLLATSKMSAAYKPFSALIPLSQRLEEPAWQFTYDKRREQS
ncbi:hypothetical protein ACHAW5_003778 [Stephanodiscus triporus]|uniref:Uncharacterized protein n=1 Tax=Stephanodiscus triporus TaxID=2934178 RepID=A0ABD3QNG9_9STRA